MTWWNRKSKPNDEPEVLVGSPGECIPCHNPQTTVVIPPPDPEPDLSTKPKDIVGYCFGYVCPKKHVNSLFETISVDGYKERRVCQTCGGVAKPATVKRISEARWVNHDRSSDYRLPPDPDWKWRHNYFVGGYSAANMMIQWTKYEFVHYLDTPKTRRRK